MIFSIQNLPLGNLSQSLNKFSLDVKTRKLTCPYNKQLLHLAANLLRFFFNREAQYLPSGPPRRRRRRRRKP